MARLLCALILAITHLGLGLQRAPNRSHSVALRRWIVPDPPTDPYHARPGQRRGSADRFHWDRPRGFESPTIRSDPRRRGSESNGDWVPPGFPSGNCQTVCRDRCSTVRVHDVLITVKDSQTLRHAFRHEPKIFARERTEHADRKSEQKKQSNNRRHWRQTKFDTQQLENVRTKMACQFVALQHIHVQGSSIRLVDEGRCAVLPKATPVCSGAVKAGTDLIQKANHAATRARCRSSSSTTTTTSSSPQSLTDTPLIRAIHPAG